MIHDKTILVGSCDWDHEHWQGLFYPDDLPEEWRLSYYANEYSAVLVPEAKWRAEGVGLEEWADEVSEGFRFYLLTSQPCANGADIEAALGKAFGGFVPFNGSDEVALIEFETKKLREWKNWLLETRCKAVFLSDEKPSSKSLSEFQSLVELMGL